MANSNLKRSFTADEARASEIVLRATLQWIATRNVTPDTGASVANGMRQRALDALAFSHLAPAPSAGETVLALREELRERTAMRYMGDCKCGGCQLVPRKLIDRLLAALAAAPTTGETSTFRDPLSWASKDTPAPTSAPAPSAGETRAADQREVWEWMRAPDHEEDFNLARIADWINERPTSALYRLIGYVPTGLAAAPTTGETVRHVKRGSTYRVLHRGAELQMATDVIEGMEMVVYQCLADGKIWVRAEHEFDDGRFAPTTGETP